MSSLSWNYQGLGFPWNVRFLEDVVRQERPTFIFLCETLSRKSKLEYIRNKLGFEGLFVVDPRGRSEGLAMLWKDQDQIRIHSFSHYHIDVDVEMDGLGSWHLTALVDGFKDALSDAGLIDMDIFGHQYTWKYSRGKSDWVEVRLDRAVVTEKWLNEYPMAKLYNLEGSTSDHSPIILVPKKI
ncbi:uncharacterized protein LOC141718646 [Apium graveolens]|uniref:uncharacterized protein LOC141718646 n=1 Tax=Apium graveolens TaxID=4045 RepID=UPI003D7922E0